MFHIQGHRGSRTGILILVGFLGLSGCSKKAEKRPIKTQPATTAEAEPVTPSPLPATQPATKPETQPAADPPCTYNPDPPYKVNLFVRRPEQKQPGWLAITALLDSETPATATGEFPRQNHIYVQTDNVLQMEIDIGFLPLAARKSIVLHLDKQAIEVIRKAGRTKLTLERRPTGEWVKVP